MSKILLIGTDIHGEEKESVVKQINLVREAIKGKHEYGVLSILREKSRTREENFHFIPNIWPRKIVQAKLLPLYLIKLAKKYDIFHFFWTPNSFYHKAVIKLCKLLGKRVIFTVISGYDKDYGLIKNSDLVIAQSPRMKEYLEGFGIDAKLIYPGIDLWKYKSGVKDKSILLVGMPYRNYLLASRCVFELLLGFKKAQEKIKNINLDLIFRGGETEKTVREFIKKNEIRGVFINNRYVKDIHKIINKSAIITNIYREIMPDMPLSGVEGICSGCVLITTKNNGLADLIKKESAGILVEDNTGSIAEGIIKAFKNLKLFSRNALKLRELFDKEKFKREYLKIYQEMM